MKIALNEKHNLANDERLGIKRVWITFFVMIIVGILFNICFSVKYLSFSTSTNVLAIIGTGLLLAGAAFAGGGLCGFIFAIPKIYRDTVMKDNGIIQNDNLVEISDWLTKIIVGVGLTQLYQIPHAAIKMGDKLAISFGGADLGRNHAIAIISYYAIVGFLFVYIWTRLYFVRLLKNTNEELNEVKEKLKETESELLNVDNSKKIKEQDLNAVIETFSPSADRIKQRILEMKADDTQPDDPQKLKWGGTPEANGRQISATIRETSFSKEWFNISLSVVSTDKSSPLTGTVVFHLHPSFKDNIRSVNVTDGTAQLDIVGWGAFTVGAECDNGKTKLELDLSQLSDVPELFKRR